MKLQNSWNFFFPAFSISFDVLAISSSFFCRFAVLSCFNVISVIPLFFLLGFWIWFDRRIIKFWGVQLFMWHAETSKAWLEIIFRILLWQAQAEFYELSLFFLSIKFHWNIFEIFLWYFPKTFNIEEYQNLLSYSLG